jgi:hypothetical protein
MIPLDNVQLNNDLRVDLSQLMASISLEPVMVSISKGLVAFCTLMEAPRKLVRRSGVNIVGTVLGTWSTVSQIQTGSKLYIGTNTGTGNVGGS